jgi:hypothetical protein
MTSGSSSAERIKVANDKTALANAEITAATTALAAATTQADRNFAIRRLARARELARQAALAAAAS